jgi:hypothetical protein
VAVANVACIKWGNKYPPYYVNRLFAGVTRHLKRQLRFLCFTDLPEGLVPGIEVHPLPVEPFEPEMARLMTEPKRKGAWRKISLFRPGLANIEGPVLGFDIDVAITGPLDELFDFAQGKFCMRQEWREARRGQPGGHGSVFRYDPARHGYLYYEFAADPLGVAARAKYSEQKYTSMTTQARGDFEYFPPQWIASFKRDSIPWPPFNYFREPKLPPDTRVMCFHGTPKMEEALEGYRGEWWRATRPATWLKESWVGEERRLTLPQRTTGR